MNYNLNRQTDCRFIMYHLWTVARRYATIYLIFKKLMPFIGDSIPILTLDNTSTHVNAP